jgi:diguanylate cyclase (GGDEF)-like protein
MRHEIAKLSTAIGFTLLVVALFCTWSYLQEQQRLFVQIDNQLLAAATTIPYTLTADFHDRATDQSSITSEEDLQNIRSLSVLSQKLKMKFLYTVIRDNNGKYRLSSSGATQEELNKGEEVHYFTAYPEVSKLIIQSFEESKTIFSARSDEYHPIYEQSYSDRWGTYRSVFIPLISPNVNRYVACADMDISHVSELLRHNLMKNLLMFGVLILAILPIVFAYIKAIRRKSREYQQVHKLYLDHSERSVTDALTNIGNRLKLDNELKAAMNHFHNSGQPFGLVMIDIDHFKNINDQFGHQIGDIVLQQFAKLLVEHSRSNDVVGRWGGEEFMIIYLSTNLEGAYQHAEKLRKIIEDSEFREIKKITASFGVAQSTHGVALDELLHCADLALYTAKKEGRNRTVKYEKTRQISS